jgi:TetR/AcrR family transcriptional regulator
LRDDTGKRSRGRPPAGTGPDSDAMLEAALKAFAERGFDGVSVRELGREIGVSHALLSARFGSKEALWFAAMDKCMTGLEQRLLAVGLDPDMDDLDALRLGIIGYVAFSAEHPEIHRIMAHEGGIDSDRISFIVDRFVKPLREVAQQRLARLAAAGRIEVLPYTTLHYLITHGGAGLFASTAETRLLGTTPPVGPEEILQYAEQVAGLIIRGLTIR